MTLIDLLVLAIWAYVISVVIGLALDAGEDDSQGGPR